MPIITFEVTIEQIINYVSITISLLSLLVSVIVFYLTQKSSGYLEVDRQYQSLLAMSLSNPKLRDVRYTKKYKDYKNSDVEFYHSYSAYAYMIWNFIETIADVSKTKKAFSKIDNVWFPVIIEENRLHYSWFVDNERLFRRDFVNFIKNKINDVVFIEANLDDLELVYPHYLEDFPEEERKDKNRLVQLMKGGEYKLFLISFPNMKHITLDKLDFIGYIFSRVDEVKKCVFIDYIAICDNYRSCGYGSIALNNIKKKYPDYALIFEIEQSHGERHSIAERRKMFYERNGAIALNKNYVFPTKDGKGLNMDLMIIPGENYRYDKKNVISFVLETIHYIHSEYSMKKLDEVTNKYIDSFPDKLEKNEYTLVRFEADEFLANYDKLCEIEPLLKNRNVERLSSLLKEGKYVLLVVVKKGNREPYGLCLYYGTDNDGIFIDYLAIKEAKKKEGLGTKLYNYVSKYFKDNNYLGVYFTTKRHYDENSETISFAKKINGKKLDVDYKTPLERITHEKYDLWFIKLKDGPIEAKWMQKTLKEALLGMHGNVETNEALIDSYIDKIKEVK